MENAFLTKKVSETNISSVLLKNQLSVIKNREYPEIKINFGQFPQFYAESF